MKSLYRTVTPITPEEFRKLNKAIGSRSSFISAVLIFEALLAGWLVYGIRSSDSHAIQISAAMLVLLPIIAWFVPRNMLKRSYASNESVNNVVMTIWFYKNYFKVHSRNATSTVRYCDLMKIIETKENFYLMIAKNKVVIVIKANCEPGLISMLQKISADLLTGRLKPSDDEIPEEDDDDNTEN
ncbi:MAG: YcxB family protein [Bilifractor sp.]